VVEIVGPSDLRFELRLQPDGAPLHSGVAPATLPDLEPGDYRIRFLRDGWQPRDLAFRLAEGETARPAPEFSTGRVVIRSEPPGARVLFEDNVLGLTPLTLEEHLPAPLALRLSLPGHEEARIGGLVEAGSTLTLAATLDASDRIVPAAELAAMPRPISQASPEPSEPILRTGGTALISLVVDKTGLPANIRVQQTDNNEFARLCVAAVREWRFSPGVAKNGQPASVRVQVPFRVAAR
jgi:TonB family protein